MKIEPVQISITDSTMAENMYITATDSWGNESQNSIPCYQAIATLTDESGFIRKKLTMTLSGEDYMNWDGQNKTILELFLNRYSWLKIIEK